MNNESNVVGAVHGDARAEAGERTSEDRRCAREAHKELQLVATVRTNLLLIGSAGAVRIVLGMLWLDLREPVLKWHPGQRLELPSPGRASTLVLQDVDELTSNDQHDVLRWLDETTGRVQVISTTAVPLWPRVTAGAFNDVLYYRLNTVCVGMAS
jgi:hypothetical protein